MDFFERQKRQSKAFSFFLIVLVFLCIIGVCCSKKQDEVNSTDAPANQQTIQLINELDELCWYLRITKNTDWTVTTKASHDSLMSVSDHTRSTTLNGTLREALSKVESYQQ